MPLDPTKIAIAMQSGLSAVCATCERYWEAQDKGLPGCTAVDGCGSPLAGDCFHEYKGPISDFTRQCFVCGEPPKYGLRAGNLIRVIGVCERHLRLVHQLRAKGKEHVPLKINGAPEAPVRTKKTLGEAIAEVENYYAKRDGIDPEG